MAFIIMKESFNEYCMCSIPAPPFFSYLTLTEIVIFHESQFTNLEMGGNNNNLVATGGGGCEHKTLDYEWDG